MLIHTKYLLSQHLYIRRNKIKGAAHLFVSHDKIILKMYLIEKEEVTL